MNLNIWKPTVAEGYQLWVKIEFKFKYKLFQIYDHWIITLNCEKRIFSFLPIEISKISFYEDIKYEFKIKVNDSIILMV